MYIYIRMYLQHRRCVFAVFYAIIDETPRVGASRARRQSEPFHCLVAAVKNSPDTHQPVQNLIRMVIKWELKP